MRQYLLFICMLATSTQLHKSYILMRKHCFMFTLLSAASVAATQEFHLDEKTMPNVYVIVSRIYSSYTRVLS